jgi:two-component sensor histidine kinase
LLGEFGRIALQTRDIGQILQRATEFCAQGLETPFAKVLEYMPEEKRLLVSAGVGWAPDTIGQVSLGVDLESPAGYAFHTGQIVISNHLQEETRFRTPKLLSQQADAELQKALEHQAMLTREMSHRVKNSLASVVGLLRVQSRSAQSEEVQNALKDAASRITTIAQVHDHLWRSTQIGFVDIADFAGELCRKLQETLAYKIDCNFDHLMIPADKAIPLGLLINELVTNAAKHAYSDKSGEIQVAGEGRGAELHVVVADQGVACRRISI